MHFDLSISLGQILTFVSVVGVGWRIDRVLMKYLFEHDLLLIDYCERKNIELGSLPTRIKR